MLSKVFPRFIAFRSSHPSLSPQLVAVIQPNLLPASVVAKLQVRTEGDVRISEAQLTREDALETVAALCELLGIDPPKEAA